MKSCEIIDFVSYKKLRKEGVDLPAHKSTTHQNSKEEFQARLNQVISNLRIYISQLEDKIKNQKK